MTDEPAPSGPVAEAGDGEVRLDADFDAWEVGDGGDVHGWFVLAEDLQQSQGLAFGDAAGFVVFEVAIGLEIAEMAQESRGRGVHGGFLSMRSCASVRGYGEPETEMEAAGAVVSNDEI